MVQIEEARPPYVQFEFRAEEDREASIAEGHYVAHDVAYAIVTPQGSKDCIERVAEDWFKHLEQQTRDGRFPPDWLRGYKGMFADWQAGNETPAQGSDIRNWSILSPAQVKMLLEVRLRTIEDVAQANEEALTRLGMGGRALKQKAQEWLRSAKDTGQYVEALNSLKTKNKELEARNAVLEDRLKKLEAAIEATSSPKAQKL